MSKSMTETEICRKIALYDPEINLPVRCLELNLSVLANAFWRIECYNNAVVAISACHDTMVLLRELLSDDFLERSPEGVDLLWGASLVECTTIPEGQIWMIGDQESPAAVTFIQFSNPREETLGLSYSLN
jgi:hypothetical protein